MPEDNPGTKPQADLIERYRQVRALTEQICAPLATDDYQVQSVVETSPPKWHLAHVSWFFETFLLQPHLKGYKAFHPLFAQLFNSYYESVGTCHPRPERHILSRPTVEEIYRYREHVDRHMAALLADTARDARPVVLQRTELGIHHEQQHQELLLMDIKRNFFANPLLPSYASPEPSPGTADPPPALAWIGCAGGLKEIGNDGPGFCFDNESPRHKVFLNDYRLASRLTANAEYLEFVERGAYSRPQWWLSDGWRMVRERRWQAPLYWRLVGGVWHEMTLHGLVPLNRATPVSHVSYYEAEAFARWKDARLPTEAELEAAAAAQPLDGNFLESGRLHPLPAADDRHGQWFGDLWEWTASPYAPYPGFKPLGGALGEYNGKFMANQYVLRGGCCVTPRSHLRATYRNFFYPHDRWPFTGIRLALDGAD